jgi:hypothetical protein
MFLGVPSQAEGGRTKARTLSRGGRVERLCQIGEVAALLALVGTPAGCALRNPVQRPPTIRTSVCNTILRSAHV